MRSLKKTEVLKVRGDPRKAIERAALVLRRGGLVAFPTETVYGLGANLLDRNALAGLYRVKRRPKSKPFTVMIADIRTIKAMGCRVTKKAARLMKRFWPGPLTVILKDRRGKRIGFRMPRHRIALRLVIEAKVPLAVPSANISGMRPPRTAREVLGQLSGALDMVLDGGRAGIGVESTVADLSGASPRILREGAIPAAEILRVYG